MNVLYHGHKIPQLISVLSHINPVHSTVTLLLLTVSGAVETSDIKRTISLQCLYSSCHMTYQIYCPSFPPYSFIKPHRPYFVVLSPLHTRPQPPPSTTRPYVTASPSCRWSPHPPW